LAQILDDKKRRRSRKKENTKGDFALPSFLFGEFSKPTTLNAVLPVLAIKLDNFHASNGRRVEAVDVAVKAIGIAARNVEGMDATDFAKVVFRHSRVECVG
jgi:hypothetical protein